MTTSESPVKSPKKEKKEKKEKEPKPALALQISVTSDGDYVVIKIPKKLIAKQLFSF